ncbi:MAG: FAD-dependent oxidoreductase, partial [Mesorhizobium sp.]
SMTGADANALVQLPFEPNAAAERTPISEGLRVSAQNVNGSLERDRDAIMDKLGRFLPVGFYYRTFMGPRRDSWLKFWEPIIRRKAGLGVVDTKAPHRHYDKTHLHCDVLVVGAGPAGLSAAVAAAEAGVDVVLCDENPEIGGALSFGRHDPTVLSGLSSRLATLPNLKVLTGTVCNGWYEDNWLPLIQGNRLYRTRAREVILATGAIEQPAVFRNNDLPGIMLGGAAQRLIRHYGVRPGQSAVVLAANDEGYRTALDLLDTGVSVVELVDPRSADEASPLEADLRGKGVAIRKGATIEAAEGTARNRHLARVRVGGNWIACDRRAASAALSRLGHAVADEPPVASPKVARPRYVQLIVADPKGRDFVDFDEDLQVKDLQNATNEGYREIELVKRFTTVGMGPSQGRHSALATARIVAEATGRTVGEIGITTARPPVGPETLGVLAGQHEVLERRTALHARHVALNAAMKPVGAWWRPYYYGDASDAEDAVREEILAVREGVGLLDVSTLGKLEIRGPDAGEFLDRLYTMAHANQPVGRVRYCLMLNEMGSVIDDGVAYRMAQDQFYVTATTGAVARVYADMLFWNAEWRLEVDVLNLTGAFSGLNVTGPKARQVLEALQSDIDFSRDAFPYLSGREGMVAGVPVRV